mgnify:CR=1 FL=1
MTNDLKVALAFQALGDEAHSWNVADYLADRTPNARYSVPLKKWWHGVVIDVVL